MMSRTSGVSVALVVSLLPIVAACQHASRGPLIEGDDYAAGWLRGWLGASSFGSHWTGERVISHICSEDDLDTIPLCRAVVSGDVDAVREEMARNPQVVAARGESGATALHIACYLGEGEIVSLLLDSGASLSATDRDGRTPLLCALEGSGACLALELIARGSPVDGPPHNTPLHEAVSHGRSDVVQALLERGAAPNCEDWGDSPLHIAAGLAIANTVPRETSGEDRAAEPDERLGPYYAICPQPSGCFAEVDIEELGTRPCSRFADLFCAHALLEHGADVDVREKKDGCTPLHIAVQCRNPEVTRLLLEYGADPYARNNAGLNAFDLASGKDGRTVRRILTNTPRWTPTGD